MRTLLLMLTLAATGCGGGDEPCEIPTGLFRETLEEREGDCGAKGFEPRFIGLFTNAVPPELFCTNQSMPSEDMCSSEVDVSCDNTLSAFVSGEPRFQFGFEGTIEIVDESHLTGVLLFTFTSEEETCSGVYDATFEKLE